jgi:hypothetical protein
MSLTLKRAAGFFIIFPGLWIDTGRLPDPIAFRISLTKSEKAGIFGRYSNILPFPQASIPDMGVGSGTSFLTGR